eukprot:10646318-Lingulodinium_polyedra.AAC.1
MALPGPMAPRFHGDPADATAAAGCNRERLGSLPHPTLTLHAGRAPPLRARALVADQAPRISPRAQ